MRSITITPPTHVWPMNVDNAGRRSWETAALPMALEANVEKLHEMSLVNGSVILEIGATGSATAAMEVSGGLAGLAMSTKGRLPQLYSIDMDVAAVPAAHAALAARNLSHYAVFFRGGLAQFRRRIPIVPTMVALHETERHATAWANLHLLSAMLAPGTPVLCLGYGANNDVTRAVDEWAASGRYTGMGRFGTAALLMAAEQCPGMPTGLPLEAFDRVREALLKVYDGKGRVDTRRETEATAPARAARMAARQMSPSYAKRGWPHEMPEPSFLPDCLPDGKPWPKISIVTPSYNYGRYLEETILSVLHQGYPNLEYIVIDGGSTDETDEVLARYRHRLAFSVSEPDKGQSAAINKGFAWATGEIFTWLNADDMLTPGALQAMAMAFWWSGADVVAGVCEQYRDGRLIEKHMTCCGDGPLPVEELLDMEGRWVTGQFFMQPEVMFTRAMWEKAGGHVKEELVYSMDYDMWLRFARAGARLHVIGRPICRFRHHGEQKTAVREKFFPELARVRDSFAAEHRLAPRRYEMTGGPRHRLRIASAADPIFGSTAAIGQTRIETALAAAGHDIYSFFFPARDNAGAVAEEALMVQTFATVSPDLVLIGTLHGAHLPLNVTAACAAYWPTGVLLHDWWSLAGGAGRPYPAVSPEEIRHDWESLSTAGTSAGLPLLLANSVWTATFVREALASQRTEHRNDAMPPVFPIRYGVDLKTFCPRSRALSRRELGLPEDRFLIFTSACSWDDSPHGIRLLAEALRLLSLPKITVVCIGTADDAMRAAFPRLHSLNNCGWSDMPKVYAAADLFVGAHGEEPYNFPQAFIDAAACGTPSIGLPAGGVSEAIADGVTGSIAAGTSANELAWAIDELYSQPELRHAMGAWSRIFAENEWSPEMAYHQLHVALRASGILERLNVPPKIRFVPHPPKVLAPMALPRHSPR